jgi:DNA-damage-inducible protein J
LTTLPYAPQNRRLLLGAVSAEKSGQRQSGQVMMVLSDATITVRMDEKVKRQFEELCSDVGMNISVAVNMFARAFIREQKLPFEVYGETAESKSLKRQATVRKFIESVNAADEPLGEEFDAILSSRINITRELNL